MTTIPSCVFCKQQPPIGAAFVSGCENPRYACLQCLIDDLAHMAVHVCSTSVHSRQVSAVELASYRSACCLELVGSHDGCATCLGTCTLVFFSQDAKQVEAYSVHAAQEVQVVSYETLLAWSRRDENGPGIGHLALDCTRAILSNGWSCGCGWAVEPASCRLDPLATEVEWAEHVLHCTLSVSWRCAYCHQDVRASERSRSAVGLAQLDHIKSGTCVLGYGIATCKL